MAKTTVVKVAGFDANISPFAFQHYAKDFLAAYESHKNPARFSPARLFLICRAIELAAKALHVASGTTPEALRKIGHDLERACDAAILANYRIPLTPQQWAEIQKANGYYKDKGFEYFWYKLNGVAENRSGPQQALSGWKNLPDENVLRSIVTELLVRKL